VNKTTYRVIYGDTDQMGVVYYANYLRYFEIGRTEYLRACGARYRDIEAKYRMLLPVVDAQVSYKSPARYDDLIEVQTTVARIGRASIRFEYQIFREQTLLVAGHTVHACLGPDANVMPLPAEVVALLKGP
jgi:acyl-CoA thioester hydrolase